MNEFGDPPEEHLRFTNEQYIINQFEGPGIPNEQTVWTYLSDIPALQESLYGSIIVGTGGALTLVRFQKNDSTQYRLCNRLSLPTINPQFKLDQSPELSVNDTGSYEQIAKACKLAVFEHFPEYLPTRIFRNKYKIDERLITGFHRRLHDPRDLFTTHDEDKGQPTRNALLQMYHHFPQETYKEQEEREAAYGYRVLVTTNTVGEILLLGCGNASREAFKVNGRAHNPTGFILLFSPVPKVLALVKLLTNQQTLGSTIRKTLSDIFQIIHPPNGILESDVGVNALTEAENVKVEVKSTLQIPRINLRQAQFPTIPFARDLAQRIIVPNLADATRAMTALRQQYGEKLPSTIIHNGPFGPIDLTQVDPNLITAIARALDASDMEAPYKVFTITEYLHSPEGPSYHNLKSYLPVDRITDDTWKILRCMVQPQLYSKSGVVTYGLTDPGKLYIPPITDSSHVHDRIILLFGDDADLRNRDLSQLQFESLGLTPKTKLPIKMIFNTKLRRINIYCQSKQEALVTTAKLRIGG